MNRRALLVLGSLFSIALLVIIGCGDDGEDNPTNPGGGSGPAFNFTFPATGTSHSLMFMDIGTWSYRCTPHSGSGMTGSVTVNASSANDSVVVEIGQGNALTFTPSAVTVKPHGIVRWVNVSSMTNHTVTRP